MIKRALVLSGGGAKGAWQLGVLQKLMGEEGRDYEIMTGVSVGALNVAALGQTPLGSPELAIDWTVNFWLDHVETKNIFTRWFPFGRLHSLWKTSLYDSRPLQKLFKENFNQDLVIASGRQLAVGAVSVNTGEVKYARETDPNFTDFALASSSFPVFLTPMVIDGQMWSDGGIKEVTPLGQAIKMGAEEVDVLITGNPWSKCHWGTQKTRAVPDQIVRVIGMMSNRIMRRDIEVIGLKNDLSEEYRRVKVRVVMPSAPLVDDSLEFNPDEIRRMLEIGYKDADNFVVYD